MKGDDNHGSHSSQSVENSITWFFGHNRIGDFLHDIMLFFTGTKVGLFF